MGGVRRLDHDSACAAVRERGRLVVHAALRPFNGTIRGSVAGFSNLRIDVAGTADAATGRIQFTYTSRRGELPGGRPITYAFTLQKRR